MTWDEKRASMRKHMEEEEMSQFLRWSTIEANMWVGHAPYIDREYTALPPRWKAVLHMEGWGARNIQQYMTSGNLIHQAYHISTWELLTGKQVEDLGSIVEIGGGYGALAKLILAQGFAGEYYIYDFEEMLTLQLAYLDEAENFIPCYTLEQCEKSPDLLVGLYSISEIPLQERDKIVNNFTPESWFILHQDTHDEIDNPAYFSKLISRCKKYHWVGTGTPGFRSHRYLIGDLQA